MKDIKLNIDGKEIQVNKGITILEAAKQNGIYIPSLCYLPGLEPYGACRLCIVEIGQNRSTPEAELFSSTRIGSMEKYFTACTTYVEDGMVVRTNTEELQNLRRQIFELILSTHNKTCTTCIKNLHCQLQKIAAYLGVEEITLPYLEKKLPVYKDEPFFDRDYNLCVLCGRCVRVCEQIRRNKVIDFIWRGFDTTPGTPYDIFKENIKPLENSGCEFCGACVDVCPTGAIIEKDFRESIFADKIVSTICPYCGVGCTIKLEIKNEKIVRVTPGETIPNEGQLCVKGKFGIKEFVHHPDRLTMPLVKKNIVAKFIGTDKLSVHKPYKDTDFVCIPWEEVLPLVAEILSKYNGDEFALIGSAKCTNEENYIAQKFARVVMKTNNIDHCARLCHAPSVVGLALTFGSGAMTNTIKEIQDAKTILAIGTNTTSTHPVIALQVKKAVSKGAKLIVINPKEIELCKFSHLWLRLKPGSDVSLLSGIAKVIIEENLQDVKFIQERCEGFEEYIKSLNGINLDEVEKMTGVNKYLIIQTARIYATEKPGTILYGMGITQHSHGTDNVFCISNLALLTGNIGKPSTGINPLRGQNNVQGACDMGVLPTVFPGYQKVDDAQIRKKFEEFYQTQLNPNPGLTLTEMLKEAHNHKIKAMYIIGANPLLSAPCSKFAECALTELEFLVVQDMFLTETAQLADIVLPACSFAEKEGTFTNTERRVQLLRKAIEPVGQSKPDWWIVCEIAKLVALLEKKESNQTKKYPTTGFEFKNSSEIMDEISKLTPQYGGVSYKRLERGGIQWPCPDETHPGTPILHREKFTRGKGKFTLVSYKPEPEVPDDEFPFILTTERTLYHYHGGTMTRKIEGLNLILPEERLEINPIDAEKLNLVDDQIVKVVSRRGEIKVKIKITKKVDKGVLSLSFHFSETSTNVLFNHTSLDPLAKIAPLKFCAVRIEKLE